MLDIGFGWSLISLEQTNSFLLKQQESTLLQIGTNYTLAAKKNSIARHHNWPHFGECSQNILSKTWV
jgi:hypothetical protein